ncbi:MAG: glycosyltransferase family A protein [Planctomycetota bacterium]
MNDSTAQPDAAACSRRILVVSPCRDEAEYAQRTLDALAAQTARPALWVIVDDGSTDATPEILARFAERHPGWVKIVRREDRGGRKVGPGVIEAFYAGLDAVGGFGGYDYVCKLDLDLDLPPGYFEGLIQAMEADAKLGTASGKPYFPGPGNADKSFDGELISEFCGDENSVGMVKFYRASCFDQIGGFVREVMWDGIDGHRCRMLGWRAASWDEPGLRFIHLRPMGSSHKGIFTGRVRHGFGQWFMGTGLAYMTASAVFRAAKRPLVVGGFAMWWGYVKSMLSGKPRYGDPAFRAFLRRWQWEALLRGKAQATRRAEARGAASVVSGGASAPPVG